MKPFIFALLAALMTLVATNSPTYAASQAPCGHYHVIVTNLYTQRITFEGDMNSCMSKDALKKRLYLRWRQPNLAPPMWRIEIP